MPSTLSRTCRHLTFSANSCFNHTLANRTRSPCCIQSLSPAEAPQEYHHIDTELLSTDLFFSRDVPIDDIPVQDAPAAPVLVRRVPRPSAAVMTPCLAGRTAPTSGPPGSHIGRQSSNNSHAMTASTGRTQDSGRSGGRRLGDQ